MDLRLASLHKHWVTADAVGLHLRRSLTSSDPIDSTGVPDELRGVAEKLSAFAVLSVWYSLLYVVVEGYQELKLRDDEIDELLDRNSYLNMLRLFRNATFHFQKDPFTPKILEFLTAGDSEVWVKELNIAFKRFFERELSIVEVLQGLGTTPPAPEPLA